jgi:hypothetical protein
MISPQSIRKGITIKFDNVVVDKTSIIKASEIWKENHEVLFKKLLKQGGSFYINGILAPSTLVGSYSSLFNSTSPLNIGIYRNLGGSYANAFNGNMSNIQIYNRTLSATEVLQNYNTMKSRFGR